MNKRIFYNRRRKPFFFLFMLLMLLLVSALVMVLWNALVPGITGWKPVNYWQAMGLLVLARILSGRFGPPMGHRGRPSMINRFRERFAHASPEEKEALKEEWRRRCRGRNDQ